MPTVCRCFAQHCRQHAGWPNQGHFFCGTPIGRKGKEKFRKEKKINQQVISTCNKCLEGKMWGAVMEADGRKRMLYLFVYLLSSCRVACGIFIFQPGIEPGSWQWKCQVLTAGQAGNSLEEDALDTGESGKVPPRRWHVNWVLKVLKVLLTKLKTTQYNGFGRIYSITSIQA